MLYSILKCLQERKSKDETQNNKISHNILHSQTAIQMKDDHVKKDYRGVKKRRRFNPSISRFNKHIEYLIGLKFVVMSQEKDGRKRKFYELSEIGKLYLSLYASNKYNKYEDILNVLHLISGKAFVGMHKIHKFEGDAKPGDFGLINEITGMETRYRSEKFDGVLPEDVLKGDPISIQANFVKDIDLSEEEINECFKLLEKKGIIGRFGIDGQIRYHIINKKYQEFLYDIWIDLFNLIDKRIRYHLKIGKPDEEETKWLTMHYGKKQAEKTRRKSYDFRKKLNAKHVTDDHIIQGITDKPRFIVETKQKINDYDKRIKEKHKKINEKYKNQLELPGFMEILIHLVCPNDLLKIMNK